MEFVGWEQSVAHRIPSLSTTNNVCIKLKIFILFNVKIATYTIFTGVKSVFENCIMNKKFKNDKLSANAILRLHDSLLCVLLPP